MGTPLLSSIATACVPCVDVLLRARANPETCSKASSYAFAHGEITPLLAAVETRRIGNVEQLLQARADVNRETPTTPLLAAVAEPPLLAAVEEDSANENKQVKLVQVLLDGR